MKSKLLILSTILLIINFSEISTAEPALKINLNPPEESVKDTIEALIDIDKLENDLRIELDEDFDEEKKKIMAIQKARIHDIVQGGFIALKSLIPNPIKASLRKAIRNHLNGKGTEDSAINSAKSMKAVEINDIVNKIDSLKQNISNMSKFKEKKVMVYSRKEKKTNLRKNTNTEDSIINGLVNANARNVDYTPSNDDSLDTAEDVDNTGVSNTELFDTNFSLRKPL